MQLLDLDDWSLGENEEREEQALLQQLLQFLFSSQFFSKIIKPSPYISYPSPLPSSFMYSSALSYRITVIQPWNERVRRAPYGNRPFPSPSPSLSPPPPEVDFRKPNSIEEL